jgi:3-isopropylmalate/(R)-2-methylmalate dehydratase large subunit
MTIVCGDSHTSTHGAFGALAFGIGTTEVGHVLASQCLLQRRPKTFAIRLDGSLPTGVTAKDLILAIISQIGVQGGTGHVFEYRGSCVRSLSMEERMTICNMSIEGGARAGMMAPDDTTFEYLAERPLSPKGADWDEALGRWRRLPTDPAASYDREVSLDVSKLQPMITYGTNPGMAIPLRSPLPDPGSEPAMEKAFRYMGLRPGQPLLGHPVDVVFIGSCTNARISDLRLAGDGRLGIAASQETGGGGGARPDFPRGGGGVARAGLLDVHCHERRSASAGTVRGQHQQSELRGTTG